MEEKKKMGRPPKYTPEEAKKARNKQHNAYSRATYERLVEDVPKGTIARLKEASAKENISKRQYVISALEERLEKTEKNLKKEEKTIDKS